MSKKILLACYEIPGYGGANTAGYKLFEIMRDDGIDVSYLNLIDEEDPDYFNYAFGPNYDNPKCLDHVYNCELKGPLFLPHPELTDIIESLSPDLLVGIGYIPALLMKRAVPDRLSVFLTAGSNQALEYLNRKKVKDVISLTKSITENNRPVIFHTREKEAVDISDLIITHSDTTKALYEYFYPFHSGKIYSDVIWFAEWIYRDALDYAELKSPFHERDIDILFIASIWSRIEKNYNLVKEILSQFKDSEIHIVGEVEKMTDDVTYHDLITDRDTLFALMGRAKTLVCPSLMDAAPGILFEASAMDCNIVTSKNCGNWSICNEQLLVDPCNINNYIKKIRLSLTEKFEDNMNFFLETDSYNNFIDTIMAM